MKRIFLKLNIFLVGLIGLTSCHDDLNVKPDGLLDLDAIFSDASTTGAYLNTCYYQRPEYGYTEQFVTIGSVVWSDDAHEYDCQATVSVYDGSTNPSGTNKFISDNGNLWQDKALTSWSLFSRNIRYCNIFLDRLPTAVVESEAKRKQFEAEIRTLRAYYFFELFMRFGYGSLNTKVLEPTDQGKDLERVSFVEAADFIIKECEFALTVDEFPWRVTVAGDANRFTKGVAAALLSRTALFKASPLFNGGGDYWAEAKELTKKSLDLLCANGYELYTHVKTADTYGDNAYYEHVNLRNDVSENPVDKETILRHINSDNMMKTYKRFGMPLYNSAKAGICPTQEFVDAFPMADTGLPVVDPEKPYNDTYHLEPNYYAASGYDPNDPYKGRDPRMEALVIHNGMAVRDNKLKPAKAEIWKGGRDGIKVSDVKYTSTGYYNRKPFAPNSGNNKAFMKMYWGTREFRLAEMYLNYAEACLESDGDIANAVAAIKPIRDRIKIPNIAPTSLPQAIALVKNERRIELGLDANRYHDLRRWQNPETGEMPEVRYITGMWIENTGTAKAPKFTYNRIRVGQTFNSATGQAEGIPYERLHYTNKYLLHPLNTDEANALKIQTGKEWQNRGW